MNANWQTEFQSWLQARVVNGRKLADLTVLSHVQAARKFAAWYESTYREALDPAMATNYDLLAYRQWSLNIQRVAAATWNVRRAGLASLAEWIGDPSLMNGVATQEQQESPIRWLDDAEYGRLVRALERLPKRAITTLQHERAIRDRALVSVMLFAGLRVSEVSGLRRSDIEIGERSGVVHVVRGKGEKSRNVPLSLAARRALVAWLEISAGEMVFDLTNRTMQRVVTDIGAEASIPGLSCHDLRHTFAKRTADGKNAVNGTPVQLGIVQKLLGHVRIETTLRYTAPGWDDMQMALGGM
ncbi:MAG TPA: hypothetical protein DCG54_07460 [Anaerolineae bacterium]|jgi:integrase|nr:hypothetical protein [Anaerolineae bacterium]